MEKCSRFICYDYPWQATFPKTMSQLRCELQALTNRPVTSHQYASKKLTDEAKFMIFIISAFLMLALIGTTFTLYDKYCNSQKKRRRSSDGEIDIKNQIHSFKEKGQIKHSEGNWNGFKPAMKFKITPFFLNGECLISLFFVLSGFLNAYFTSRDYFKNGGKISWLRFYRKRILRIAPLYVMILGFYAILFSYVSSGPLWPTYGTNPVCKESWWWNLFFLNNFQTPWKQCFLPAWYVAVDIQFHLISPFFIVLLLKWPKFGYTLIPLSICASCCYRSIMTIKNNLFDSMFTLGQYLDGDKDLYNQRGWIYVDLVYTKPIPNFGAYTVGLGLGHYVWKEEIYEKRSSMIKLCCGWIGCVISMWICFDVLFLSEKSFWKHVSFNGFSDFLFSCGVAWIIFVCATKKGGFVSRLLSLKIFIPLSRLSFAAYLINCIVILYYFFSSTKQGEDFSLPVLFGIIVYVGFWTYIISFIASLFVEVPMSRVLRLFHYI